MSGPDVEILVDLEIGQTNRLGQDPVFVVRCLSLARTNVRGLHMKMELVTICRSVKQVSRKRIMHKHCQQCLNLFCILYPDIHLEYKDTFPPTGYTLVLSSTGPVAEYQGSALGEFVKTGDHEEKPYYRQRGQIDLFLFYALGNSTLNSTGNTNGWYVGPVLGDSGNSDNSLFSGRDSPSPPGDQWQFSDQDEETWREVDNSFTLEYTFLAPCQSLRVSGYLGRSDWLKIGPESYGEYRSPFCYHLDKHDLFFNRLEAERWSYGRPVYQKISGRPQELLIAKGTWQIRRSTGEKRTNIRSSKGTNNPSWRHAGPSALDDTQNWFYLDIGGLVSGDIRVDCV